MPRMANNNHASKNWSVLRQQGLQVWRQVVEVEVATRRAIPSLARTTKVDSKCQRMVSTMGVMGVQWGIIPYSACLGSESVWGSIFGNILLNHKVQMIFGVSECRKGTSKLCIASPNISTLLFNIRFYISTETHQQIKTK